MARSPEPSYKREYSPDLRDEPESEDDLDMPLSLMDSSATAEAIDISVGTTAVNEDDYDVDAKMEENSVDPSRSTSVDIYIKPDTELSTKPDLDTSRPSNTPPVSSRGKKAKSPPSGPQLIGHLPRAEEAARKTFTEIEENHYQYGTLGRSREALESMTCDCQYEHGVDNPDDACGADCINRLTQVECSSEDCRCHSYCRNQRFQRKHYAPIEIVQTEKKGFGLRTAEDLPRDTFIYEYVGDVVSHPSFLKRMRQYAEEGIRHFYFMMLQKEEYIDATKRGGIGRFANHSCNPNCYVAKWTVGNHVRMGIFANRYIRKNEELTFNYNVDRYGHEAQPCYCGEPKCVGFIGGKTQTDIAAMDDLYLDALGISEEVDRLGLKGSKKRKSKKLDEDFIPTLKPLTEKDVPKVVQAMRQTPSRKVLLKLLTRIKLTEDQSALRQLMRLRGFSVMTNILEDHNDDVEMLILAIECMMTWPLIQRNKVEDSKVNVPVKICSESENETLAELAKKLLGQWDALEYAYRIPKRLKAEGDLDHVPSEWAERFTRDADLRPTKRARQEEDDNEDRSFIPKPLGFSAPAEPPRIAQEPNSYYPPVHDVVAARKAAAIAIIAAASAAAAASTTAAAAPSSNTGNASSHTNSKAEGNGARRKTSKHKRHTKEEKEELKEKRLLKLVGAVVVKCMSKYQKQMDHDLFKKHAKELTHIIAEKEKKSSSYKEGRLDALSEEKTVKIKKFAKEYIAKVMRKLAKSGSQQKHSQSEGLTASSSASTYIAQETDADAGQEMHNLTVEDATGLPDSDEDDDDEDTAEHSTPGGWMPPESKPSDRPASSSVDGPISDPRLRHRHEEYGWDPDVNLQAPHGPGTVSVGS